MDYLSQQAPPYEEEPENEFIVDENGQVLGRAGYYHHNRQDAYRGEIEERENSDEQSETEADTQTTSKTHSSYTSYSNDYEPTYDETTTYDSEYDYNRNNDDSSTSGSSTSTRSTSCSSSTSANVSGSHRLSAKQLRHKLRRAKRQVRRRDDDDDEEEERSDEVRHRSSRRRNDEETETSSEQSSSPERPRHRRRRGGQRRHWRRRADNYNASAVSDTSKTQTRTTTSTTTSRQESSGGAAGDAPLTANPEAAADIATAGLKSRFVKIVAIAAVKPDGKYDIVDVEIHPWKPGPTQATHKARPTRLKPRAWTGGLPSQQHTSGAVVASASKARHTRSAADGLMDVDVETQRHSTKQYSNEMASDFSQNNNNREGGQTMCRSVFFCAFDHRNVNLRLCRVLSLSDRRYSLNPLSQTRID